MDRAKVTLEVVLTFSIELEIGKTLAYRQSRNSVEHADGYLSVLEIDQLTRQYCATPLPLVNKCSNMVITDCQKRFDIYLHIVYTLTT